MNGADHVSVQANVSMANVKCAIAHGRNQNVVKTAKGVL